MEININDGGRAQAGYKGTAGDCVVRAIAIASGLPYQKVYDDLKEANTAHVSTRRDRAARAIKRKGTSPRDGNYRKVYHNYLLGLGFTWTPTMGVGTGCRVHLKEGELPQGRIIARVSKHLTAVINGVMQDTFDASRAGTRCVYGYYTLTNENYGRLHN